MKRILILAFLATPFLFSCSKAKQAAGIESANWHVNGVEYGATTVTRVSTGTTPQIMANGDNTMQVFFSAIPTTGGSFKVVSETKTYPTNTLASNEIAVEFNVGANDVYLSKGTDNVYATISVGADGKLTIDVPSIVVEHFAGAGSLGTTTADGNIIE